MTPQTLAAIRILALVAAYRERFGGEVTDALITELARRNCQRLTNCGAGKKCAVAECENRAYGLNLYCPMHRLRYQRHGDPNVRLPRGRKKQ